MKPLLIILSGIFVLSFSAHAHTRSQSSSSWTVHNTTLSMNFSVDTYRATLLAAFGWDALSPPQMLARHLSESIIVQQNGAVCARAQSVLIPAVKGKLRYRMQFVCNENAALFPPEIFIGSFFPLSSSHQHLFYGKLEDGRTIERVLTAGNSSVIMGAVDVESEDKGRDLSGLIILGIDHVTSGLDHILFLLALVMVSRNWKQAAALVSCFTIGHMAALYFVASGVLSPSEKLIEALIGFSILFMAIAALAKRQRLPSNAALIAAGLFVISIWGAAQFSVIHLSFPIFAALTVFVFLEFKRLSYRKGDGWGNSCIVTLLFSLAHGAGFAGGLMEAGFQKTALLYSIFFFNLGVEAGQLFIIAAIFFSLYLLSRVSTRQFYGRSELAIAIALIWAGSYYFFGRI